jgi:glutamate synthase domain-containing protein 3
VIGPTGRNFAAGMSGGIAFVLDEEGLFSERCNKGMVELDPMAAEADRQLLRELIGRHFQLTGSAKAKGILDAWEKFLPRFVKVMPVDYRRSLLLLEEERKRLEAQGGVEVAQRASA